MTYRKSNPSTGQAIGFVLVAIAAAVGLFLVITGVIALILTWAWNLVVPTTFGGPTLDFGAAFALVIVLSIIGRLLFGGRSSK